MKKYIVLLAFAAIGLMNSCVKETAIEHHHIKTKIDTSVDKARTIFAKTFAKAIANEPELKEFIIKEAKKRFNGDYDILYVMVKDKKVGRYSFAEILQQYSSKSKVNYRSDGDSQIILDDYFANGIISDDPYLTIYIPKVHFYHPELLDLETNVAIVGSDTDEKTTEYLEAYDSDGNPIQVDAKDYPTDISVFIIKMNERILLINKNTNRTINDNDYRDIMRFNPPSGPRSGPCDDLLNYLNQIEVIIDGVPWLVVVYDTLYRIYEELCRGGGSVDTVVTTPPCDAPCERDCWVAKDEIYKIKFNSYTTFKEACSWWDGDLEMYVIIVWGNTDPAGNTSLGKLEKWETSEREDWFDDCSWINSSCDDPVWQTKNWETFTWDARQQHSWDKKFEWWEEDGKDLAGSSITVGSTFSYNTDTLKVLKKPLKLKVPLSISLKYNPKDDKMGDNIVEYCDDAVSPGEQYNSGTLKFHYRRRN